MNSRWSQDGSYFFGFFGFFGLSFLPALSAVFKCMVFLLR
jgi:hypothetical protein